MIGFIGGTGSEGRGLALRFAAAGEQVSIGSREESRAIEVAAGISDLVSGSLVSAGTNQDVARIADILFVTVPYVAHRLVLESVRLNLEGKIVVDAVVPLSVSGGVAKMLHVADGSAAQEAQVVLGRSSVVAAFHTISASDLFLLDSSIDSDVIACSNDTGAKKVVMGLVEMIPGMRAVDAGPLYNAVYLEGMAALLININRVYRRQSSIRVVGI